MVLAAMTGWVLLLCLLLTIWEPLNLALLASAVLPQILDRPAALAILGLRIGVTGLGVAAGLSLWMLKPHGVTMAKAALVLSAITSVLVFYTRDFPSNRMPGARLPATLALVAYSAAWYGYLQFSKRVRDAYGR